MNDGLKPGSGRSTKIAQSGMFGYAKGTAQPIVVPFKSGNVLTGLPNFVVITDATSIGAGGAFAVNVNQHSLVRPGVIAFAQAWPTDRPNAVSPYSAVATAFPRADGPGGALSVLMTNISGGALAERVSVAVMLMSVGV